MSDLEQAAAQVRRPISRATLGRVTTTRSRKSARSTAPSARHSRLKLRAFGWRLVRSAITLRYTEIAIAKNMSVIDTARFMALVTIAEADAIQSVFAAKWHYLFWRPMTAIRNGDIDGNAATERDATWEPLDTTPLHPEYPCAHCILSGAVTTVIQKVIGSADIPEVSISSPTAPGVVHKATNANAIADEISLARIYAGFHYRNSTEVGRAMGQKIGEYRG